MAELLMPIVRAFDAGNLRFRRDGRNGDGANRWEIVDPKAVWRRLRLQSNYGAAGLSGGGALC
jgi:hypothetical protein